MTKTVPVRVADFLRQNRGFAYCDDCIRQRLGFEGRQQAQQATKPLGLTSEFARLQDRCA